MAKGMEKFGERVRFAREMRGLTQAQLAEKAGLDQAVMSHIEKGTRVPGAANIAALSRAMMVTSDYLLGLSERVSP